MVEKYGNVPSIQYTSAEPLIIKWDGTNANKRQVGNGTYLCWIKGKYYSEPVTVDGVEVPQDHYDVGEEGKVYLGIIKP
jgi:flagellar hook assembly protein FlgD